MARWFTTLTKEHQERLRFGREVPGLRSSIRPPLRAEVESL
jgi:hypothetical protein